VGGSFGGWGRVFSCFGRNRENLKCLTLAEVVHANVEENRDCRSGVGRVCLGLRGIFQGAIAALELGMTDRPGPLGSTPRFCLGWAHRDHRITQTRAQHFAPKLLNCGESVYTSLRALWPPVPCAIRWDSYFGGCQCQTSCNSSPSRKSAASAINPWIPRSPLLVRMGNLFTRNATCSRSGSRTLRNRPKLRTPDSGKRAGHWRVQLQGDV
jgi:hypothetical protein